MNDLALILDKRGKTAEAETLLREAVAIHRTRQGDPGPNLLDATTRFYRGAWVP